MSKIVMVTGMQAAGKSTIGPLLAQRIGPLAAALDGDVFYDMVEAGNVDMTPDRPVEAGRQVRLRYRAAALVARHYADNGFDVVYTDIVLGDDVTAWFAAVGNTDAYLVVLDPSVEAIVQRETSRGGNNSYRDWQRDGMTLHDAVAWLRQDLDATPRRGLWLDTSTLTAEETVDAILADGMAAARY